MKVPFPSGLREVVSVAELDIHGVRCFVYLNDDVYVLSEYSTGRWLGEGESIPHASAQVYERLRLVAKKYGRGTPPGEALRRRVAEWVVKDGVVNALTVD